MWLAGMETFLITLIPRGIDEFVTQKYKIVFVLQKCSGEERYEQLLVEIKKGLFEEVYSEFPQEIKMLIQRERKLYENCSFLRPTW